jgi:peptidoglycan LD-endopeptidase LytH
LAFIAAMVIAASAVIPTAGAQADQTDVDKAVAEVTAAHDRANAAAASWGQAQSELDQANQDAVELKAQVDAIQQQVTSLQTGVQQLALQQFASGNSATNMLLTDLKGVTAQVERSALTDLLTDTDVSAIDQYQASQDKLVVKQAALDAKLHQIQLKQAALEAARAAAQDDIATWTKIQDQALKDQAIAKALEQQAAAEKAAAKAAFEQAAAAAAAARAKAAAAAAAAAAANGAPAAPAAGPAGPSGPVPGGPSGKGVSTITGGCVGACGFVDTSIVCPVGGPSAFSDTWGAPRSGGRRHQGVDMLGARGTPIIAVVDGIAKDETNGLGGNAVGFVGNNGNSYYYAHLESWAKNGPVRQGDVIGYMGDTGDAKGTVHLHFEVHPGNGAAVDPFPSAKYACG